MKQRLFKISALLSSFALFAALATSGATCMFTSYQPQEPNGLAKFKK